MDNDTPIPPRIPGEDDPVFQFLEVLMEIDRRMRRERAAGLDQAPKNS